MHRYWIGPPSLPGARKLDALGKVARFGNIEPVGLQTRNGGYPPELR